MVTNGKEHRIVDDKYSKGAKDTCGIKYKNHYEQTYQNRSVDKINL